MTQTESLTANLTVCLEDSASLPATSSTTSHARKANCRSSALWRSFAAKRGEELEAGLRLATCSEGALDNSTSERAS